VNERWVDGFNVIHRLPELAALAADDLEECRDRFLRLLAPIVFRSGERWSVIFDAPRAGRGRAPGPIDLVYASDADAWILDRLRAHPHPAQVCVVSSDEKDIGREARALGARVMPADELVATLRRRQRREDPGEEAAGEKPEQVSPEEVDYWLDQFGDGETGEPKGEL